LKIVLEQMATQKTAAPFGRLDLQKNVGQAGHDVGVGGVGKEHELEKEIAYCGYYSVTG
jgi:hypothetical protein